MKPSSVVDSARALIAQGQFEQAVALVQPAARNGDPDALNELGLWHVYGQPLRRDFVAARQFFAQAGDAGHHAAALTHAAFVAIGAGGAADWAEAMRLLGRAAAHGSAAAGQRRLLEQMALDPDGGPKRAHHCAPIFSIPRLSVVRGLFSRQECEHVIARGTPLLRPSIVVDPVTGRQARHPIRTSDAAVIGPIQTDLVIEALNRRIAAATATAVGQGEPLSVLRYAPGQQYRVHHDCLPGEENQRALTVIVYLNDGYEGGETYFPEIGMKFRGQAGDAIVFANTRADGQPDTASRHAGLPVTRGTKWICTRWIRASDFDPWGMRRRAR